MENIYAILFSAVDRYQKEILAAERRIWGMPETGFREWKTHSFMKAEFEKLGYTVKEAGNIPGFYAEADSGREGPCVALFGELDALIIPDHPECDRETGAVHACGHHCQCAAMLGVAAALKAPNALEALCGRIRMYIVPAEELIEFEYRKSLADQGIIRYYGGKQEFIRRGLLDGVDMALQIHSGGRNLTTKAGGNGCVAKHYRFIGKASHAAGPAGGINALYAATNALGVSNALREQFSGNGKFRFHPIITNGGEAVNVIPAEVTVESFIRDGKMESIHAANAKFNRAFAGCAAAMGCRLVVEDKHGYAPRKDDENLNFVLGEIGKMVLPEENVHLTHGWDTGCTDMGDISLIMPQATAYHGCSTKPGHSKEYVTEFPEDCLTSAKIQAGFCAYLLQNGAAFAKKVIAEAEVPCRSKEEYFATVDALSFSGDTVFYGEDGEIRIRT